GRMVLGGGDVADLRHRLRVTAPRPHLGQPLTVANRLERAPVGQMHRHQSMVNVRGDVATCAPGKRVTPVEPHGELFLAEPDRLTPGIPRGVSPRTTRLLSLRSAGLSRGWRCR